MGCANTADTRSWVFRVALIAAMVGTGHGCVTSTGPEGASAALALSDGGTGCNTTSVLVLKGVTCPGCREAVLASLVVVPGVVAAEVNLSPAEATVQYCETVDTKDLIAAVKAAGYGARLQD